MKTQKLNLARLLGKWISLSVAVVAARGLLGADQSPEAKTAPARRLVVAVVDICPPKGDDSKVGRAYFRALESAGHVPFLLPRVEQRSTIEALLGKCDLVLLAGGEDVDPARYGESKSPKLEKVNRERDAFEYLVMDEAVKLRKPLFGICRGCQILNCHFGGSLVQDIPSEVGGKVAHRINEPRGGAVHSVRAVAGSRLAAIMGESDFKVVSWHHQSVEKLGRGIRVSARAADGVVEAIESDDYPLAAVQFHPEKDHRDCPVGTLRAVFENLGRLTDSRAR